MEASHDPKSDSLKIFSTSQIYLDMLDLFYKNHEAIMYAFNNPKESPLIIEEVDMGIIPATINGKRYRLRKEND